MNYDPYDASAIPFLRRSNVSNELYIGRGRTNNADSMSRAHIAVVITLYVDTLREARSG